ncbi:VOC family protein [Nocardioides mangrovicus]|uniref:VOC family protein n=1 Tax=Nocardioides mangrovicus TaxID=2478913 RepID=A0A3L8P4D6_9ACTN|nr:VOC family protein [Nocardioides mangrovicus]RLV49981.1 VOC family protein [Nocardioides mangrovicus]
MRFDHWGLNVADLDAAEAWYGEALGVRREVALRIDPISMDVRMLLHPEHGYRLELLSREGAGGDAPADPAEAALRHGYGHVALSVDDLDAEHDRLVSLGARSVMAPQPSPEPGVRMVFLADPFGNLVELLQR